jgi:hypothetical protein
MSLDAFSIAVRHGIVRDTPAVNFFEGALLGNGGLGAVVCVRPDAVLVHFGHNNVWDIRLAENNKDKIGTFREVFEKVRAIPESYDLLTQDPWYDSYYKMAQENYRKPYPRPFPCGTLVLGFDRRKVESLGYHLSLADGLCRVNLLVDGAPQTLELFTDMGADRLWLRMLTREGAPAASPFDRVKLIPDPETPGDLPPFSHDVSEADGRLSFRQTLPRLEPQDGKPGASHPGDKAFRLQLRLSSPLSMIRRLAVNGLWKEMDLLERRILPSAPFLAVVQLDEGLASVIPDQPFAAMPEPLPAAYAAARGSSEKSWQTYWSRSAVALDDADLERTWYRNLYFLNCAVREGVTCPGLFANWSYRKIGTPWHGDYHMNYNTQQPFWVTFSSNHVEKHLPYVNMVHHLLPSSKAWAKDYYQMRGAFFPHSAYPVEMTMNPYPVPTWGWEVFETPWTVQSLWWHYLYTRDLEFLSQRAFGPLQEAAWFMIDYMTRPDAHGEQWGDDRYHIFPTVPPELYGLRPGFKRNVDGLYDLTLTKFLFNAFAQACKELDCEATERETLDRIREILAHYPDYPTAETEMGTTFVSVRDEEPGIVYNCPGNTATVFPGEEHGLHSSSRDYSLSLNSYRYQQNEGGNELVFLNLQAARLGVLDIERFKRQINYCCLPNGTCTDKALQAKGRYQDTTQFDWMGPNGVWFENFALPVVINECLMQSYNGIIRLFPNWPEPRDAQFKTLRAVGAFLVSCERRAGKIRSLTIGSEKGGSCRLYSPWPGAPVIVLHGQERIGIAVDGNVISFDTVPGATYEVMLG